MAATEANTLHSALLGHVSLLLFCTQGQGVVWVVKGLIQGHQLIRL